MAHRHSLPAFGEEGDEWWLKVRNSHVRKWHFSELACVCFPSAKRSEPDIALSK
jgi:hypothetical protein